MRFPRETHWQGKPFIGTPANGGFTSAEVKGTGERYLHHAVHIRTDGTVGLANSGERIDGFFVMFDGDTNPMLIYRDSSKGSYARNGGTAPIAPDSRLVGAEKTNATFIAKYPQCGYVKAVDTTPGGTGISDIKAAIDRALYGVNNICRKGGSGSAADVYPPADVVVEHGIATDAGN